LATLLAMAMSTTIVSMMLLLQLPDTNPGQNKGVFIYTTAALEINKGEVNLALPKSEPQARGQRIIKTPCSNLIIYN
jgi:hypothetical protein